MSIVQLQVPTVRKGAKKEEEIENTATPTVTCRENGSIEVK